MPGVRRVVETESPAEQTVPAPAATTTTPPSDTLDPSTLSDPLADSLQDPLARDDAAAGPFSDLSADDGWVYDVAQQARDAGIVTGHADGTFRPGDTLTQQELLAMMLRALGEDVPWDEVMDTAARRGATLDDDGARAVTRGETAWIICALRGDQVGKVGAAFSDTADHEYGAQIEALANVGVFQGDDGAATARPDDTLNRAEGTALALRVASAPVATGGAGPALVADEGTLAEGGGAFETVEDTEAVVSRIHGDLEWIGEKLELLRSHPAVEHLAKIAGEYLTALDVIIDMIDGIEEVWTSDRPFGEKILGTDAVAAAAVINASIESLCTAVRVARDVVATLDAATEAGEKYAPVMQAGGFWVDGWVEDRVEQVENYEPRDTWAITELLDMTDEAVGSLQQWVEDTLMTLSEGHLPGM